MQTGAVFWGTCDFGGVIFFHCVGKWQGRGVVLSAEKRRRQKRRRPKREARWSVKVKRGLKKEQRGNFSCKEWPQGCSGCGWLKKELA